MVVMLIKSQVQINGKSLISMNRKTIHALTCILTITIFVSCQRQETEIVYNIQEMPTTPLIGELLQEELLAPYTKQMEYIQSSLFHFTPQHQEVCLVTNEKADTIGNLCTVGNGSGEIINWAYYAGTSPKQDTIYIYDCSAKK